MKIDTIKEAAPESQPCVIPKVKKTETVTRVDRYSAHKYSTRSRTKRFNHMNTFKNAPTLFWIETAEKIKLNRGSD